MKPWAQGCPCPSALGLCGAQPGWPETGKPENAPGEATGHVRLCIVRHCILRRCCPQGGRLSGFEGGVVVVCVRSHVCHAGTGHRRSKQGQSPRTPREASFTEFAAVSPSTIGSPLGGCPHFSFPCAF